MGKSKRIKRKTSTKSYSKGRLQVESLRHEEGFSEKRMDSSTRFQDKILHRESKLERATPSHDDSKKKIKRVSQRPQEVDDTIQNEIGEMRPVVELDPRPGNPELPAEHIAVETIKPSDRYPSSKESSPLKSPRLNRPSFARQVSQESVVTDQDLNLEEHCPHETLSLSVDSIYSPVQSSPGTVDHGSFPKQEKKTDTAGKRNYISSKPKPAPSYSLRNNAFKRQKPVSKLIQDSRQESLRDDQIIRRPKRKVRKEVEPSKQLKESLLSEWEQPDSVFEEPVLKPGTSSSKLNNQIGTSHLLNTREIIETPPVSNRSTKRKIRKSKLLKPTSKLENPVQDSFQSSHSNRRRQVSRLLSESSKQSEQVLIPTTIPSSLPQYESIGLTQSHQPSQVQKSVANPYLPSNNRLVNKKGQGVFEEKTRPFLNPKDQTIKENVEKRRPKNALDWMKTDFHQSPRTILWKSDSFQTSRIPKNSLKHVVRVKVPPTNSSDQYVRRLSQELCEQPVDWAKDRKWRGLNRQKQKVLIGKYRPGPLKKTVRGLAKAELAAATYLQTGADENVAVEAVSKGLNLSGIVSLKLAQRPSKRRMVGKLTKQIKQRQSQLAFRQKYRLLKEDKVFQKQTNFRKALYRQSLKKQLKQQYFPSIVDRLKKEIKHIFTGLRHLIRSKGKAYLVVFLGVFLLVFSGYSTIQTFIGGLSSISFQTTSTSYLSSEEMLIALNHIFSTYELNLSNELSRLKTSRPGYDEYRVRGQELIGHDPHMLLAYLTARFGEITDQATVEPAMRDLFQKMYAVDYKVETEIRYRTEKEHVEDSSGKKKAVERKVAYTHRILVATVSKKDMDDLVQTIFKYHPNNLDHYRTLKETKGNVQTVFPTGPGGAIPPGVSTLYNVDLSGGSFPPPNPNHIAALNGGAPGQCTWYVYNRFSQLGKPIQYSPMGNGGEWAYYAANYGYPVSREARAGTAICFPAGVPTSHPVYGHIGFVERVNSDGSLFISEMNVVGEFVISTRTIPREIAAQCYYINYGL